MRFHRFDRSKGSRQVSNFLGTVHHEYVFTVDEALDAIPDVIYHLETFDVTTIRASTPMYLMARRIRATGVKMVLSGEGADEIFGGRLRGMRAFWRPNDPNSVRKAGSSVGFRPLEGSRRGYLYFHKAPNCEEFHAENVRKIKQLHLYDCLRANKAMMAWGVEDRL